MSNGKVCCILLLCCAANSDEQVAAMTALVAEQRPDLSADDAKARALKILKKHNKTFANVASMVKAA